MKALILSGGSGSRLRPLTFTNAKQLLPLANKPILFYIIEKVVNAGIKDIGIVVGGTHEEVTRTVGDGERWNASIEYIYQESPLGLAHAVKLAGGFIGDDDFLMILGDNIFSMELDSIIENFYSNKANATIMLHKVSNPSEYGVAVVENDHIIRLAEKPKEWISDLIITGIYLFDSTIFQAIEDAVPSHRGELEITDAIQNQIESGGLVTFEVIKGWWKDTGKLEDMLEANRLVMNDLKAPSRKLFAENSDCSGKIWVGGNVTIQNSKLVGPVVIADNCVITDSYIGPFTAIGANVLLNSCEVDNSILLEHTTVQNVDKRISGSLIGKNAVVRNQQGRPFCNSFLIGDNSVVNIE